MGNKCVKFHAKNSERLLRNYQKTLGDTFLPHTVQGSQKRQLAKAGLFQAGCRPVTRPTASNQRINQTVNDGVAHSNM